MKRFSDFKSKSIKKLETCKKIIGEAREFVNVEELLEKIERTIEDLKDEKFRIVFFGGFSDGKTTILSALLNRTDLKISPAPTTDKIEEYLFEDYIIIDTPGLFSEHIEHDEKTKKYISETDLVIFVTNAMNPLRESQHQTIEWLLRDLGKLDQTIFVINRLDETGIDINNKDDFTETCSIKKDVVVSTLNQILGIERKDYLVVCLVADPWEMGIKYWLENKEEYEKLSNIRELEKIINSIIEKKKYELIQKKVDSVIKDVVLRIKSEIEQWIEELEMKLEEVELQKKELQQELDEVRNELIKTSNRIKERLDNLRRNLITDIQATADAKELKEVIQKEIGTSETAEILKTQIEKIYEKEIESLYRYLKEVQNTLEKIYFTYEEIDNLSLELVKKIEFAGPMLRAFISKANISSEAVLKTRDFFKLPIKFKPWGATKLAGKISTALKGIGILIEVLIVGGKVASKIMFDKKKDELIRNLNELFGELINQTNPEFLKGNFLFVISDYEENEKLVIEQYENYNNQLNKLKKLNVILNKCKEV
ncbi:LeoA/HP0731 family dynamin-like GTPase [Persephonella sp.]|uniref:LeoA/HP0731 family dynamin-like GTPase n=1 Tax=Persephonella sp. TaxID=2060922 RepID=UPI00262EE277|nr:LeoA/HP0731 family dynamin-like GTPase [Persephonella sp.]